MPTPLRQHVAGISAMALEKSFILKTMNRLTTTKTCVDCLFHEPALFGDKNFMFVCNALVELTPVALKASGPI